MAASDRRQRAFARREHRLLGAAERVVADEGCQALSMDRLGSMIDYSRATVYLHFSNKSDVMTALAAGAMSAQLAILERVLAEPGRSRERMLAVYLVFEHGFRHRPHLARVTQMLYDRRMIEEASEERRSQLDHARARTFALAEGLVREAWASGDLEPETPPDPTGVLLPIWSLMVGGGTVLSDPEGVWRSGPVGPVEGLRAGWHALMDGIGWRPTWEEHDYRATTKRLGSLILETIAEDSVELSMTDGE